MSPDLKRLPHSPKVSTKEWDLNFGALDEPILARIEELLEFRLSYSGIDGGVSASLPAASMVAIQEKQDGLGGQIPIDPLTIYIAFHALGYDFASPTFSFSFSDLVRFYSSSNGPLISQALRALADEIDSTSPSSDISEEP